MKTKENIESLIKKFQVTASAEIHQKTLTDALAAMKESKKVKKKYWELNIWSAIMENRVMKFTALVIVIIGIILGFHLISETNKSGLIFANVVESIKNSSYTFDLTIATKKNASGTLQVLVLEPGRMRLEASTGLGRISSIIDTRNNKSLILFHKQKTGFIGFKGTTPPDQYSEVVGIFALCMKPIENLWNLRDGTEKELGQKDIDGQTTEGFEIVQEDSCFRYDITIWAHAKTGIPILVEITSTVLDDPSKSMKWIMQHFNLDAELDTSLFSLELPLDYTLAYQKDLKETVAKEDCSSEAEKIKKMLETWRKGQKDESVRILLEVDWTKSMEFSGTPYIFTVKEKEYISLKPQDQQRVMKGIMETTGVIRQITKEVSSLGQQAMSDRNYIIAEQYIEAGLQLGKLLTRDSEYMVVVRLVGIAAEKFTLRELIKLYSETNQPDKLQAVKKEIQAMEAESENIKRKFRVR